MRTRTLIISPESGYRTGDENLGLFEEGPQPIGYLLKRVQHSLRLAMDEKLREYELSTPQYAALWALGREPG
ncbi:MAG: hypothetical protein QOJ93_3155, partial [Actinomycetota bacterium]|nr:hypothetical protein [Actinomycetota bacterium]